MRAALADDAQAKEMRYKKSFPLEKLFKLLIQQVMVKAKG
jgi:hypothetical protein